LHFLLSLLDDKPADLNSNPNPNSFVGSSSSLSNHASSIISSKEKNANMTALLSSSEDEDIESNSQNRIRRRFGQRRPQGKRSRKAHWTESQDTAELFLENVVNDTLIEDPLTLEAK